MATSTFDRPLVLEKDEDIERFWEVMKINPEPRERNWQMEEDMRRCAELFKQMVRNERLRSEKQ